MQRCRDCAACRFSGRLCANTSDSRPRVVCVSHNTSASAETPTHARASTPAPLGRTCSGSVRNAQSCASFTALMGLRRSRARIARLPRNAVKNSEYRFPRERFNQRKKYKLASSPCAKEVLALRELALKKFVSRTTLFPTTEQLRCSLMSHGVLGVLVETR